MLDIDDAIQATTYVSPGKLSLGEGNGTTRTLTIRNDGSAAKSYSISHLAAAATGTIRSQRTRTCSRLHRAVQLDERHDRGRRVGERRRDDRPERTLPDLSMYSGYVVIGASDGSQFSVPYVGLKGDYQAITILTGLVALARPTATPGSFSLAPAGMSSRWRARRRSRTSSSTSTIRCRSSRSKCGRQPGRRCTRCSRTGSRPSSCRGTAPRPSSSRSLGRDAEP